MGLLRRHASVREGTRWRLHALAVLSVLSEEAPAASPWRQRVEPCISGGTGADRHTVVEVKASHGGRRLLCEGGLPYT